MFSYLFGGSKHRKSTSTFPSSASSPHTSYPPSASTSPSMPPHSRPSGEYDDVALDAGAAAHPSSSPAAAATTSGPPSTGDDGAFVGGPSHVAAQAYPPVPSFARPSYSSQSIRYPPVAHTLTHLATVLDAQSPTLLDSLAPPLSPSDPVLASLRAALAPYSIPSAVLDSYLVHDGQDPLSFAAGGGGSTGGGGYGGVGLVWGLWWMPLERVEEEWKFWRKLEQAGGEKALGDPFSANLSGAAAAASSDEARRRQRSASGSVRGDDEDEEEGMSSFPVGWVRRKYTHPGWLPLLTDRCGNYIGVDLDPPVPSASDPTQKSYGQAGQVIAFGREIDEKVVLFPGDGSGGWARFLASFVEDLEKGEFARLGERPGGSTDNSKYAASDEESLGGREGSDGSGSGEGENWDEDGLGDRGYFEASGSYGEDVVSGVRGDSRSASTWVLRSQYRRLAGEVEGGIIGVIAERSRRKWRSLGVGSAQPRPQASMSPRRSGAPLSVVVPITQASSTTGVEVEEEPASAMTMRGPSPPATHPLSPNANDQVEVVLSPPSPKGAVAPLPLPVDTTSTPPSGSPRTSQESHRGGSTDRAPQSPDGFLRDPPRAYKASQRNGIQHQQQQQPTPRARRAPPPPPAPIAVPIFSDLDFSDSGYPSPMPPSTSQLASPEDGISSSTSALTRLSFSSQRSGERTPTTPSHLLPTSRSNSLSSAGGGEHLARPAPVRPTESSTSISMLNELAERSTTALVPGRDIDDDSVHLGSPPLSSHQQGGVEVVVHGAETGSGLKRVASPLDSPYEEQGEFPSAPKSPQVSGLRSPRLA
ncbi:hypothetical protein JCM10212_001043 [Sporobolomyces blumeae]